MSGKGWPALLLRLLLSALLLGALYLVVTRAIAYWYFRDPKPDRLRQALRWDPRNPAYHAALARVVLYSPESPGLDEAIAHYEQAVRLAPHQARYWAELGGTYELVGRNDQALAAYERARDLFPNSPEINWQLGNFYLRAGRLADALRAFQKSVRGDPKLRRPAFDLAWRAAGDVELILAEMIPADPNVLFGFLHYLGEKQRMDEAAVVWNRLLALGVPFELRAAFRYLDGLIYHERIDELVRAWAQLAERFPTQIRQSRFNPDLIVNGDFEGEILNGGLDWRISEVEGAEVSVDSLTFFDGTRSLRIRFDGKHNLNYQQVLQYVPVKPNATYRFMGYMRTQGITTDSGPRFEIYDAYRSARLFLATENMVGTATWTPQQVEFKTPPETRLLAIRVGRPASRKFDNQIAGTVWVDRLSLLASE